MRSGGGDGGELSGVRNWPEQPGGRQRIVNAVIELVEETGLRGLTLSRVLERAQTNNRAFYRHFDNLEHAITKIYEEQADALVADLLGVGLAADSWQSGLRAAVDRLIRWAVDEPGSARLLLVEYRNLTGTVELHERGAAQLAQAIDLARGEVEESRQPPPKIADLAIGAIESQLAARLRAGHAEQLEEMAQAVCYVVVLIYHGREAALEELE